MALVLFIGALVLSIFTGNTGADVTFADLAYPSACIAVFTVCVAHLVGSNERLGVAALLPWWAMLSLFVLAQTLRSFDRYEPLLVLKGSFPYWSLLLLAFVPFVAVNVKGVAWLPQIAVLLGILVIAILPLRWLYVRGAAGFEAGWFGGLVGGTSSYWLLAPAMASAVWLARQGKFRWASTLLVVGAPLSAFFTGSRSTVVIIVGTLAAVVFATLGIRRSLAALVVLVAAVVGAIAFAASTFPAQMAFVVERWGLLNRRGTWWASLVQDDSTRMRIAQNDFTLQVFSQRPLSGGGMRLETSMTYSVGGRVVTELTDWFDTPLATLAKLGLLGFLGLVVLVGLVATRGQLMHVWTASQSLGRMAVTALLVMTILSTPFAAPLEDRIFVLAVVLTGVLASPSAGSRSSPIADHDSVPRMAAT